MVFVNIRRFEAYLIPLLGLASLLAIWTRFIFRIPLETGYFDWYSINLQLNVIREGLLDAQLPSNVVSVGVFDYAEYFGDKFWTFPYLIRTPDLLLLAFTSNKFFVVFHLLFYMSLGYVGFLILFRKFGVSWPLATVAGATYFYSGIFVGRIAAGHLQLMGYFFVPTYILIIFQAAQCAKEKRPDSNWILASLLLSLVAYLGSIQTLFQMLLFTLILSVSTKFRKFAFKSIISLAVLISPIIFSSLQSSTYALSGDTRTVFEGFGWRFLNQKFFTDSYLSLENSPSLISFLAFVPKHLLEVSYHLYLALSSLDASTFRAGWEWDAYLMPLMLIPLAGLLSTSRLRARLKDFNSDSNRPIMITCFIFFILSLSLVYRSVSLLIQSVFSINAIDRLPVRSLIYPLTLLFLICVVAFSALLKNKNRIVQLLGWAVIFINLALVMAHSEIWLKVTEQPFSDSVKENSAFLSGSSSFEVIYVEPSLNVGLIFAIIFSIACHVHLLIKYWRDNLRAQKIS